MHEKPLAEEKPRDWTRKEVGHRGSVLDSLHPVNQTLPTELIITPEVVFPYPLQWTSPHSTLQSAASSPRRVPRSPMSSSFDQPMAFETASFPGLLSKSDTVIPGTPALDRFAFDQTWEPALFLPDL